MTLLLLVRHGVTDATGTRLVGWTRGIHLSEAGRRQADAVRDRLADLPLEAVYSSPLERCRETARPLAAARSMSVRVRRQWGEIDYGSWTNRPLRSLARTNLWRRVQSVPSRVRFPDGESFPQARGRIVAALDRIAAEHPGGVVVAVSHADPIKLAIAELAGMHLDMFQRVVIDPGSVSAVWIGDGTPRLLLINETGSLGDLAPLRGRAGRPKHRT